MVQKAFLVAAPFLVSHVGLPDWGSDGGGEYLIGVGTRCSS
jgi:hypothetical protein